MKLHPVDQERVDELCRELRPFLDAELAAGNHIVETWKGWPHNDSLYIMLANPFRVQYGNMPEKIQMRAFDDPHYWKSELICKGTHHAIACRFI
jgi:hypothetical protein